MQSDKPFYKPFIKEKNMKKALVFLLVLLTVLPCAIACKTGGDSENTKGTGDNTTDGSQAASTPAGTEDPFDDKVPEDLRFDGRTFTMTGPIPSGYVVFYQEEDSDDPVDSAVYKRNMILEDRFAIKIVGIELGQTDSHADAFSSYVSSGDDIIDVMGIGFYQSGLAMIINDYVLPWNDVKYINVDRDWWNKSATETLSILGNYYYLTGDINVGALRCTMPIFFNKTEAEEYKDVVGDLYQTVRDGKWTYELFLNYIKAYSHDNGDDVQDENDYYGLVQNGYTLMSHLYYADVVTAVVNDNGAELMLTDDKIVGIVDRARELLNNKYYSYVRDGDQEISDIFFSDRALFMNTDLSSAGNWRDKNTDFGILPLPKYDEAQENYTTYTDQWGLMLALPCTAQEPDRTGAVLEAMAALSKKLVTPAYYDVMLLGKLKRDDESEEMLDILYKNVVYDPGTIYAGDLNLLPMNACVRRDASLTTWYAQMSEALLNNITILYDHVRQSKG